MAGSEAQQGLERRLTVAAPAVSEDELVEISLDPVSSQPPSAPLWLVEDKIWRKSWREPDVPEPGPTALA